VNHSDPTGLFIRPDELPGGKEGGGGGGVSIDWTFVDAEINLLIVLSGGDLIGTDPDPVIPWIIYIPSSGRNGTGNTGSGSSAPVVAVGAGLVGAPALPAPVGVGTSAAEGVGAGVVGGTLAGVAFLGGMLYLSIEVSRAHPESCYSGEDPTICLEMELLTEKLEEEELKAAIEQGEQTKELVRINKLVQQGKLEADGMAGYPNGMPPDEPNGEGPRPPGRGTGGVAKPTVADPKLNNLVKDLYKGANAKNPIGTGSTADAIRRERATGQPVGGKFHTQKGQEYARALQKWLDNNPAASESDRAAARAMMNDLRNALDGK
jgi:hypothetical protein